MARITVEDCLHQIPNRFASNETRLRSSLPSCMRLDQRTQIVAKSQRSPQLRHQFLAEMKINQFELSAERASI